MTKRELKTVERMWQALNDAINDLESWASSGPEGFTKEEAKRFKRYNKVANTSFNLIVSNQPKG